MINMIKADLFRMKKSKGLYIFLAAALVTYLITLFSKTPGGINLGMPVKFSEDTKLDIRMLGFNFTWYFLLIIPVFLIVAADFSEKTVKNTISSAISRKKYYVVKYVSALLFNIGSFLFVNVLFWIINLLMNGSEYSSDFTAYGKILLYQLPLIAAVTGFFIMVAFWVKRAAAYNAITIIVPLALTMIGLTLYGIKATKEFAEKMVLKYELSYMLNLIANDEDSSYTATCMLMGTAVLVLTFIAGYLIFTRKEIE